MPPNTDSGSILNHVEYKLKQVANPYSDAKSACFEECPGTSGSGHARDEDEEPQEQLMDNEVRVTTRARLTYELYKYSKNAMLIVNSTSSIFYDKREEEVEEFKSTFEKFGFEVDVASIGLNHRDLYETCEQFFQRDFTEYGSVALVVLTPMSLYHSVVVEPEDFEMDDRCFEDSVIMENFDTNRNPTLEDKPMIYISEAMRGYLTNDVLLFDDNYSVIGRQRYGNVIGFHACRDETDSILYKRQRERAESRPLIMFCKKLAAMGENVSLPEIIAQSKTELHHITKAPIDVVNTLTKELYFTRMG